MKSRSLTISIDGIQYDRVLPPNLSIHGKIYRISKRINNINFHINTKIQVNYSSIVEFDLSLLKAKQYLDGFNKTFINKGDLSKYLTKNEMLLLLQVKPELSMSKLLEQKLYDYENAKSGNDNDLNRYAPSTIDKFRTAIRFWKKELLSLTLGDITYPIISKILSNYILLKEKKYKHGPSKQYVEDLMRPLREIFCSAKKNEVIENNPFERLDAFSEIYVRCKDPQKNKTLLLSKLRGCLI